MKNILWILSATLVHFIFFDNNLGLNVTAFSCMAGALTLHQNQFKIKNWWAYLGLLLFSLAAAYNSSFWIMTLTIGAALALFGLETENTRRTIFGLWVGLSKMITGIKGPFKTTGKRPKVKNRYGIRPGHLILPIGVSLVFVIFYSAGVPAFGNLIDGVWKAVTDVLEKLFHGISMGSIAFFVFALFSTAGLVYKTQYPKAKQLEDLWPDHVKKKKHHPSPLAHFALALGVIPKLSPISLKHEMKISTLMLGMLNFILMVVLLSGYYQVLWPETQSTPRYLLVHEGTTILILSLIAGTTLLVYFFRGNINFLKNNALLKKLSFVWLGQNLGLALLDVIYNYRYIAQSGLTYKRIGVYFFLILVVIGLVIVLIKIIHQLSTFRVFTLAVYSFAIVLGITLTINWDEKIVHHNINSYETSAADLAYVTNLSYRAIPALLSHDNLFDREIHQRHTFTYQQAVDRLIAQYEHRKNAAIWSQTYVKMEVDQAIEKYLASQPDRN